MSLLLIFFIITIAVNSHSCYSASDPDGKRVVVSVFLGSHGIYHKYIEEGNTPSSCMIAALFLSGKTKWDMLDCLIRRVFKVQQILAFTIIIITYPTLWRLIASTVKSC